jgi:protein ImuB
LPPDKPVVIGMRHGQQRFVSSVDEAAARAGLSAGMTVTHAQSLAAGLTVIQAAPDEDLEALTRLGFWCTRYAPLVTPDPPDGVFFDVAGSAHLFRGEAALIDDLIKRLEDAGISARAAVADTRAAPRTGRANFLAIE